MAQEILQGDIFGRIGKQFGEGIAEQVPRNQLSKQLSGIQGLPPQVAQAALIPGGLQALQPYLPYLQSNAAAQASLPSQQVSAGQGQIAPSSGLTPSVSQTEKPAPVRLSLDPESINQRAAQEFQQNPAKFKNNFEEARAFHQRKADTQASQIESVRADFKNIMEKKIQKGGNESFADILGDLQENFAKQAEDAVLSGSMTDKEAARFYGDKALDFAKARNKFTVPKRDFWRSLVSGSPLKEVMAAKKAYDAVDMPEAFLNDLVAKRKFSLPIASEIAFPPSQKAKSFFNDLKYSGSPAKIDAEIFDKALELLTPKDSLQAYANELKRKGYSPTGFLDYASANKKLEPFQERELESFGSFEPSLTDILYFTMSGKKP